MKGSISFLALVLIVSMSSCGQKSRSSGSDAEKNEKQAAHSPTTFSPNSEATFAAGCFWHEETLFESIKGVGEVVSGYAGGTKEHPSYEDLETGSTGHTETVNIAYDSNLISYKQLLEIFIEAQEDPTQVNGQGPDLGTQYRSAIFYRTLAEKKMADEYIAELDKSGKYKKPIAAQVLAYTRFWKAEDYHQNYIDHNADEPYVRNVSIPDIRRWQAAHPDMVKPGKSFVK